MISDLLLIKDQKTAFLSSNRDGGQGDDDIYLALPVCNLDLITTVHDKKTGAILANATITVVDQKLNVLGNSISDEMGIVNFHLECDKTYFINVDKNGYIGEVIEVEKSSGGEVAINADLNPKAPIITQTEVILSDINFDFNKSNITQEGAAELDKLVAVMTKYPEMVIFAKSHTDSRGDDKYNMLLSDRRAKSTVQYIISKGIAVNRITGEGFGKSEPKVQCDKCTEAEHQKNRRSEFMIVKK
ncbi:OmpA family protein [Flavobacterium psychrophilum]|uniref:OmpA family protein n=1 Tax=Flavobacterium psychrophilum TaxID=96345 RepID=UPI0039853890